MSTLTMNGDIIKINEHKAFNYVSLGKAAKLTGKSKPTISAACRPKLDKTGKEIAPARINATQENGQYQIEVGELFRVYPAVTEEKYDPVEKPPHYTLGNGMQCIEYIKQVLSAEEFKGYCNGNVIKYLHRHSYKNNPVEDIRKAKWYLERMLETMQEIHK